jgi:hypothetical protein
MQLRTQSTRSRPSAVSATSTGMAPPRPYAGRMSHSAAPPGNSNVRRAATITLSSSCSNLEIMPSRRRSPTAAAMICRRASAPLIGVSGLLFTFLVRHKLSAEYGGSSPGPQRQRTRRGSGPASSRTKGKAALLLISSPVAHSSLGAIPQKSQNEQSFFGVWPAPEARSTPPYHETQAISPGVGAVGRSPGRFSARSAFGAHESAAVDDAIELRRMVV